MGAIWWRGVLAWRRWLVEGDGDPVERVRSRVVRSVFVAGGSIN